MLGSVLRWEKEKWYKNICILLLLKWMEIVLYSRRFRGFPVLSQTNFRDRRKERSQNGEHLK